LQGFAVVLLLALLLDRWLGDPQWLWRRVPHPVTLFGALIKVADRIGNRQQFSLQTRFMCGWLATAVMVLLAALSGFCLMKICRYFNLAGLFAETVIVSLFLAQKSLAEHVMAVHAALQQGGVRHGRQAVAMIVGRNPHRLDKSGVCGAAIESLAENSSDGVVAPALWYLILGLPGLLAYKMLNTADSMIGHKNDRYGAFGYAAARLDDVANYIPARLTGYLVVISTGITSGRQAARRAWQVMRRDAGHHRSPNAGWPESAFAGALDIRLAGPRYYGDTRVEEPFQNPDGRAPGSNDIPRAIRLFRAVMALFTAVIGAVTLLFSFYVLYAIFF